MAHGICWEPPIRLWSVAQPCSSRSFGGSRDLLGASNYVVEIAPTLYGFGDDPQVSHSGSWYSTLVEARRSYGVPFDGYSVFHFGEHRTAPNGD